MWLCIQFLIKYSLTIICFLHKFISKKSSCFTSIYCHSINMLKTPIMTKIRNCDLIYHFYHINSSEKICQTIEIFNNFIFFQKITMNLKGLILLSILLFQPPFLLLRGG